MWNILTKTQKNIHFKAVPLHYHLSWVRFKPVLASEFVSTISSLVFQLISS